LRRVFRKLAGFFPCKEILIAVTIPTDVFPAESVFVRALSAPKGDYSKMGQCWDFLRKVWTGVDWPKVHLPVANLLDDHHIHKAIRKAFPCVEYDFTHRADIQEDMGLVRSLRNADADLRRLKGEPPSHPSDWIDFANHASYWVYFHADRRWVPAELEDAYRLVRLRDRRAERIRARAIIRICAAVARALARMYRPPHGAMYRKAARETAVGKPAAPLT